jgi:hypothetical protein
VTFLCGLHYETIELFSMRGPCREDMREYGNGNLLHLSSKGTAVSPEEELEDLVCDVTCDLESVRTDFSYE